MTESKLGSFPEVLKENLAAKGIDVSLKEPMTELELEEVRKSLNDLIPETIIEEKL